MLWLPKSPMRSTVSATTSTPVVPVMVPLIVPVSPILTAGTAMSKVGRMVVEGIILVKTKCPPAMRLFSGVKNELPSAPVVIDPAEVFFGLAQRAQKTVTSVLNSLSAWADRCHKNPVTVPGRCAWYSTVEC